MHQRGLRQAVFNIPGARRMFHAARGRRPRGPEAGAGIANREQLPLLLNQGGLTGVGAEIGVQTGAFSEWILDYWKGRRLISIDPWLEYAHDDYVDVANCDQASQEVLHQGALRRLHRFRDRSSVWRMTGSEAATRIEDESLDFAYLDARHDRASVEQDLLEWWPKIRPGGMLAGHDYLDGDLPAGIFGVKTAVDAFAAARQLRVDTTSEPDWPSWIIMKPLARET